VRRRRKRCDGGIRGVSLGLLAKRSLKISIYHGRSRRASGIKKFGHTAARPGMAGFVVTLIPGVGPGLQSEIGLPIFVVSFSFKSN
jgi:hypothetical protein